MKKQLLTFSICCSACAVFIGCSKPTPVQMTPQAAVVQEQISDGPVLPVTTTKTRNAPLWIDNADRDGHLNAVGIAKPNSNNDKYIQRTQAVNRAYAALAQKLQQQVDSLYQELATTLDTGKMMANTDTKFTLQTFVSQQMKGATVPYFWTDTDGTLYALAKLSDHASYDALNSARPDLAQAIKELEAKKAQQ
jgi:hypothetical protein